MEQSKFKIAEIVSLKHHEESAGYVIDIIYSKFHREPAYFIDWFRISSGRTLFDWNAEFLEKYLEGINEKA
jgi:hypothetical protein